MKNNFSNWKEFNFVDIFEIKKGFYNKKPQHSKDGTIPFLGATEKNNGVTEYYSIEDIENASKTGDDNNAPLEAKIFPAHAVCITNNGSVGYAYYQDKEFTCSHDVNPLYIKDGQFNQYTGLFVATVIEKDRYRWAYGRKWRPERMLKSKLMLPKNGDGKPDWKYMESFIKSLKYKNLKTKNSKSDDKMDTNSWQYHCLGSLFEDIYKGKPHIKNDVQISELKKEGYIQFISRTEENNGCDCYVALEDVQDIEKGNAIIIGDTTSTCFYQNDDFICGDHIVVCRASWLNKYTALFIKSVLEKERYRYSYGRAFKMDLIKSTVIKLPTLESGLPDWGYMEKYIKSLSYGDRI